MKFLPWMILTKTRLLIGHYEDGFRKKRDCTNRVAKTKALTSFCEADLRLCFRIDENPDFS